MTNSIEMKIAEWFKNPPSLEDVDLIHAEVQGRQRLQSEIATRDWHLEVEEVVPVVVAGATATHIEVLLAKQDLSVGRNVHKPNPELHFLKVDVLLGALHHLDLDDVLRTKAWAQFRLEFDIAKN